MIDLSSIPPIIASIVGGILWLLVNRVLRKIQQLL